MKIDKILNDTKHLHWQEKLLYIAKKFSEITFSTSFGIEDQVIHDFIARKNLQFVIFTIDTGRLPSETYEVWHRNLNKYEKKISVFYPQNEQLENFVNSNGINGFYNSKDLRLKCCEIRKIEPLSRALKGKKIWISGLRREHSLDRSQKNFFEYDNNYNLIKFYPLLDLRLNDVWNYIKENNVPYNKLYDKGYKSIGCAPCSRATEEHEDIRAGRWWWESDSHKECGLHLRNK